MNAMIEMQYSSIIGKFEDTTGVKFSGDYKRDIVLHLQKFLRNML